MKEKAQAGTSVIASTLDPSIRNAASELVSSIEAFVGSYLHHFLYGASFPPQAIGNVADIARRCRVLADLLERGSRS